MKPALAVSGRVVLGGVLATVICWPGSSSTVGPENARVEPGTDAGAGTAGAAKTGAVAAADKARPADRGAHPQSPQQARPVGTQDRAIPGEAQQALVRSVPGTARAASAGRRASSEPSGTPRVSARLAFKALLYVGVDPEAEKTWMRAINDPNLPPGVRSDLIEDLNDEGYEDPSGNQITKRDLPLILARLEIIERLAPYAMDQVNADAFEEAYKDLLNMYVRLGGSERE